MDTIDLTTWIHQLQQDNKLYRFYKSKPWLILKAEVLTELNYECQHCKDKGIITRAVTVHHEQHVKRHPHLALSKTYEYQGKTYRNLTPLCHDCHDAVHGRMQYKPKPKPLTEERW